MTDRMQTVQGRCPACHGAHLFLADGGRVTCSLIGCPEPGAADGVLHGEHVTAATPLICSDERHTAKVADLQRRLAELREVARGYCGACGRGDAAPTVADWERERQRAEQAEAEAKRWLAFIERGMDTHMQFGVIKPDGSTEQLPCADWCYACRVERAEAAVARVRAALAQFDNRGVIRPDFTNLDIPTPGEVIGAVRAALDQPTPATAATQATDSQEQQ